MDPGSRSLGGLLAEPITRHAYPAEPLRRGVPATRRRRPGRQGPQPQAQGRRLHRADPGRRDGLGHPPPRVARSRRQGRRPQGPAGPEADLRDDLRGQAQGGDGRIFQELIKAAAIENQLTGTVKLANEEKDPDYGVDDDVKLMSGSRRQRKTAAQASRARRRSRARRCRRRSACRRKPRSSSSSLNRPSSRAPAARPARVPRPPPPPAPPLRPELRHAVAVHEHHRLVASATAHCLSWIRSGGLPTPASRSRASLRGRLYVGSLSRGPALLHLDIARNLPDSGIRMRTEPLEPRPVQSAVPRAELGLEWVSRVCHFGSSHPWPRSAIDRPARLHPRHSRFPQAGHPVQGHHAAALAIPRRSAPRSTGSNDAVRRPRRST